MDEEEEDCRMLDRRELPFTSANDKKLFFNIGNFYSDSFDNSNQFAQFRCLNIFDPC